MCIKVRELRRKEKVLEFQKIELGGEIRGNGGWRGWEWRKSAET